MRLAYSLSSLTPTAPRHALRSISQQTKDARSRAALFCAWPRAGRLPNRAIALSFFFCASLFVPSCLYVIFVNRVFA
jgi:hypothetical protein